MGKKTCFENRSFLKEGPECGKDCAKGCWEVTGTMWLGKGVVPIILIESSIGSCLDIHIWLLVRSLECDGERWMLGSIYAGMMFRIVEQQIAAMSILCVKRATGSVGGGYGVRETWVGEGLRCHNSVAVGDGLRWKVVTS